MGKKDKLSTIPVGKTEEPLQIDGSVFTQKSEFIGSGNNKDFGNSKFDTNTPVSMVESGDFSYLRGQKQDNLDKLANGLTRGIGAAAQTLYDGTVGIGYGAIKYANDLVKDDIDKAYYLKEHGNLEGYKPKSSWTTIFDNTATRAGEELTKGLEDVMPLYGTKEYEQASGLEKIKFMNFWADDVMKGLGTTLGSMPLGIGGSKLFNAIGKNFATGKLANGVKTALNGSENLEKVLIDQAKSIKIYNAADKLVASTFAAVSESGMEARGTGDKLEKELMAQITANGTRTPTQSELDWKDKVVDDAKKAAFGFNMAVITGVDFLTFSKYMASNKSAKYLDDAEKLTAKTNTNAGKLVGRDVKEGATTLGTDYSAVELSKSKKIADISKKAFKTVIGTNAGEGIEENLQTATDWGVIDYAKQKYYGKQDAESLLHAMGQAFAGSTSDEGIESFLAGFISGGISNTVLSKGGNIKEMFTKDPVVNNALKELNIYNSQSVFGELIQTVAASQAAVFKMDAAISENNTFVFKNAQSDLTTNYVLSRIKTGKYDDLKSDLNDLAHMPAEEIERLYGVKIGDNGKSSVLSYVQEKIKAAEKIKEIHDASYVVFPEGTISNNNRERLIHANVSILDSQNRINSINKEVLDKTTNLSENYTEGGKLSTVNLHHFTRPVTNDIVNYNDLTGKERAGVRQEIVERLQDSSIAPVEIPGIVKQIQDLDKLKVRRDAYKDLYNTLIDPKKAEALDKEDAQVEAEVVKETNIAKANQETAEKYKEEKKAEIENNKAAAIAAAQARARANGGEISQDDVDEIAEEFNAEHELIDSLDIDAAVKAAHEKEAAVDGINANISGDPLVDIFGEDTRTPVDFSTTHIKGYVAPNGTKDFVKYYKEETISDGSINYLDAQGEVIGNSTTHTKSQQGKVDSSREVVSGVNHFNKMVLSYDAKDAQKNQLLKQQILAALLNIAKEPSKIKEYIRIVLNNKTALDNKAKNKIITTGNAFFNVMPEHNLDTEIVVTDPKTGQDIKYNWLKSPNVYTPKKEMTLDGITYKPGDRIDLTKLSYETFIKYFTADVNKDMSETDFEAFKRSVIDINNLRQQLNNFYESSKKTDGDMITAAQDLYNLALNWEFNYIKGNEEEYPTLDKVQYAKNKNGKYVIYQTGIETFIKGPNLEEGDISTVPTNPGSWLQLNLPDGTIKWLQIRPAKAKPATKLKQRIQEAADNLAKVQPGDTAKKEAQDIITGLGLFVAGRPGAKLDFSYGWNKTLNKFTLRFNVNEKSIDMSEPVKKDSPITMLDETLDRFINRVNFYLGENIVTEESFREDISGRDNIKNIEDKYVSTADAANPMIPTTVNVYPTGKTYAPAVNKTVAKKPAKTAKKTEAKKDVTKADIERRRQEELSGKRTPEELSKIQQTYENNIKELEEFKKYGNTIEEVFDNLHDEVINTNPVLKLRSQGLSDEQIDKHPEFIEWKRKSDLIDRINDYYSPRTIMNDGRTKSIDDFITEEKDSIKELPNKKKRLGKSNIDSINAKYDAELAALKGKGTPESDTKSKAIDDVNKAVELEKKGVKRGKKGKKLSDVTVEAKDKISLTEAFEYLRDILPQSINLKVIEDQFNNGKMLWGYFSDSVLALNATAAKGTEYHEAFHAVFRTLLGDRNIDAYINEAKRETNYSKEELAVKVAKIKEDYSEEDLTTKEAEDLVYEEYLADKFMDWKKDIRTNTSSKNKSLFRIILDFIKNFLSHKSNIDKLFERIDTGYYKYSDPVVNRFTRQGQIAFKAVPGLTIAQTRDIVTTVAATVIETGTSPETAIEEYIENIVNPDSEFNKEYIKKNKALKAELESVYTVLTTEEGYKRLNLEVAKRTIGYEFDPITESFKLVEEEEGSPENWQVDHFNIGGVDLLGAEVRQLIALTLYDTVDQYGRKVRKAVDLDSVYNTIITNTIDTPTNQFLPKLESVAKYNPQLQAVIGRIKNITENRGLEGQQLFKKITKAFEKTKMNYLTIRSNEDGRINIFNSNNKSPEKKLFDSWSNRWLGGIQNKFKNDKKSVTAFKKQIALINKAINNNLTEVGKKPFQELVIETLNSIGIDITEGTVDLLFTPTTEANQAELDTLRAQFNDLEKPADNFWTMLSKLVESGDPLFKGKLETGKEDAVGFVKQLMIISTTDKHFRSDLFESSFQDARDKQRYSFIAQSYLTDKISELKQKYVTKENIEEASNDPYHKLNPIFNLFKDNVYGAFKNLDVFFTGDLVETSQEFKRSEKVDGVTAKNIQPKEYLLNMLALFSDGIKDGPDASGITRAKYIIGVEEGKSQIYAASLPVIDGLVTDKGTLTSKGITSIFNTIFSQELNRVLDPNDKSPNKGKFVYLSALNDKVKFKAFHEALDNIVNDRITFDNAAITAIDTIFKEEIESLKDLVKQYQLEGRLTEGVENSETLDAFLGSALVNDFLMTSGLDQLIDGDLSNYKTLTDKWKRNSGRVAAGMNRSGRNIKIAYSTEALSKGDPDVSGEDKISTADGQVYSTLQDKINLLDDLGRLTPKIENILRRLNSKDPKEVYSVTEKEVEEVDLVSAKLVTYGVDDKGNHIYHKMSVFPLSRRFTSYYDYASNSWKAIPGREKLHNKREWMEENGVDQLIDVSASKLWTPKNAIDHNSFSKENFNPSAKLGETYNYDGKYQRLQVENESGSHMNVNGTQKIQLITSGLDMSKTENIRDVNNYYKKLDELRQSLFKDAMRLLSKNGRRKSDISLFIDKLLRNAETSGGNFILEQFLAEEGGDFKYDPNLPHLLSQFEKYFLAHFNKGTLIQKTSGNKLTLVSDNGFKVIVDKQGRVIKSEDFLKTPKMEIGEPRSLKIHKFKNNKLNYAEVAMTRRSAFKVLGLRIDDTITEEELLTMLGTRIPSQSQHSMMPFKVVEFLPDEYGDVIIGPKELVWLSGADFDIDKLYTYKKNYYISESTKKVTIFGKGNPFEEYKISQENSKLVRDVFKKMSSNDPRFVNLKIRLERIQTFLDSPIVKLQASKIPLLNNSIYQLKSLLNAINDVSADVSSLKEELLKANMLKDSITDSLNKYAGKDFGVQSALKGKTYNDLLEELKGVKNDIMLQAFKELELPYTSEQFKAAGKPKANEALQNELLDMELSLLDRPELHERMKTPASTSSLKKLIKLLELETKKSFGVAMSMVSKLNGKRSIDIGKENIGISANGNILNAWLTTNKISVKDEYGLNIDGKHLTSFEPLMEEDFDLETSTFVKKDKGDTISTELSSAADNAKEQLADLVNRNPSILNNVLVMEALGVGQTRSTLMAIQPIIKELSIEFELSNSNIDKKQIKKGGVTLYRFSDVLSNKAELLTSEIEKEIAALPEGQRKEELFQMLEEHKVNTPDMLRILKQGEYTSIEDKITQLGVISNFINTEAIYGSNSKLLTLLKVNKGVGSELDGVDTILEDFNTLQKKESIVYNEDFIKKFSTHPNLRGNFNMANQIKKTAGEFFIRQTKGYEYFSKRLLKLFGNKNTRKAFQAKSSILTFLNLKIYEKTLKEAYENNDFTLGSLNTLAYPDYEKGSVTLATQMKTLIDKYPEFANNDLIKWLAISPADENYTKSDKLSIDTRSKLSNDILEKFSESLKEIYMSENEDIRNFSLSLFDYLVVSGNLRFTNDSLIKFVGPEFFQDISENLTKLTKVFVKYDKRIDKNNVIGIEDLNEEMIALTGYTFEELSDMFNELYARSIKTSVNLINIESDSLKAYFKTTNEDGILEVSPVDINKVKLNGIIEVEGNDEFVSIIYPKFLKTSSYNRIYNAETTTVFKLQSINDTVATYKEVDKLSDLNNPIMHMTIAEAEKYTKYIQSRAAVNPGANREISPDELDEVANSFKYNKQVNVDNILPADDIDAILDNAPDYNENDPGSMLIPAEKGSFDLIGDMVDRVVDTTSEPSDEMFDAADKAAREANEQPDTEDPEEIDPCSK